MEPRPPKHRFLAGPLTGSVVTLDAGEAHHALHVLRLTRGDRVEVFDGVGRSAPGCIARTGRDSVDLEIGPVAGPAARCEPALHVAFAVPKGKRLDWLLEKLTELGVRSLRPLLCDRSVAHPKSTAHVAKRWRGHCASAAKQSGQSYLPIIEPEATLGELLQDGWTGRGVIADGAAEATLGAVVGGSTGEPLTILIGPEGGWTDAERAAATDAGFTPVRLGHTILRIETAAVAVCAGVIALAGDRPAADKSAGFDDPVEVPS